MRLDNIIKGVLIGIKLVIQINKKIFMYNNNFIKKTFHFSLLNKMITKTIDCGGRND